MSAEREMTLEEWCAKLHDGHLVNRQLKALQAEIEALRNPWVSVWFPVSEGRINNSPVTTMINQLSGAALEQIELDIFDTVEAMDFKIPENAFGITVKASKFNYEDGQISFPETGQWDFPPYVEMEIEFLEYTLPAPPIAGND